MEPQKQPLKNEFMNGRGWVPMNWLTKAGSQPELILSHGWSTHALESCNGPEKEAWVYAVCPKAIHISRVAQMEHFQGVHPQLLCRMLPLYRQDSYSTTLFKNIPGIPERPWDPLRGPEDQHLLYNNPKKLFCLSHTHFLMSIQWSFPEAIDNEVIPLIAMVSGAGDVA